MYHQVLKSGSTLVPLVYLSFLKPTGGLPPIMDWATILKSMSLSGVQLSREPLDVAVPGQLLGTKLSQLGCLRLVKGFSRATCVAFVALLCSEVDLSGDDTWSVLQPLYKVLDHSWLVPVVVQELANFNEKDVEFRHMELSYRGSERQRPNVVQQALKFVALLEVQAVPATESSINMLIEEWNVLPVVTANRRWQITRDGKQAIQGLTLGLCKEALCIIRQHLDHFKFNESGG